ncbi:NnrU family protein [Stappia sp. P2PMeth1]|uniref:NnrU family protein n=1 Tax=Stappia sp. P2PMeth1 TaxID=2003586 RepID=UPI0016440BAA|nr:NnrU family protein [Stappia sp. P2PMeth1]
MTLLVLGLVVFFGVHLLPMMTGLRERLRARFGAGPYRILFSIGSIVGFVLLVYGYGAARAEGPAILYYPPVWLRHLTTLLMLPVFVLLVASGGPIGRIKMVVKHPMVLAVKIWAVSHLLANGDAASVLLFGSFLVWAVVDRISLKRRPATLGGATAGVPSLASDIVAIAVGLGLYIAFVLFLHEWLIGVPIF